jgi:alkylation response protein AidB-like acyl-CoA dehydrogenase
MYRTVEDAALIEAAQRIAPLVRACRDEGERERRLPAQVLAAMHEARLFRMYIPKALDGLEIDPITSMIVVEEIARADAAAAWNLMLGATYGLWAAFLPEHAAREIYGAQPTGVIHVFVAGQPRHPFLPVRASTRVSAPMSVRPSVSSNSR